MKKIIIIFLLLSVALSQVTLTEEESKNITNNIIELQVQVDSLTTDTNLKAKEIDLLNKKVALLEEELTLTESGKKNCILGFIYIFILFHYRKWKSFLTFENW